MPVVGLAEVLVKPVFTDAQRTIGREMDRSATAVGRSAGARMGKGMADGFSGEAKSLEAEVGRLETMVNKSQASVADGKKRLTAASAAESKALGDLRVAELKLQEARDSGSAKASALASAEERVKTTRDRVSAATVKREASERALTKANADLDTVQKRSSAASENLATRLRNVGDESTNTERNVTRLGSALSRLGSLNPFRDMSSSVKRDSDRMGSDLLRVGQKASLFGSSAGQAVAGGAALMTVGLSAVVPAAGAAGAALISASGNVLTLASSMSSLGGVAALVPAGLITVGASVGVLKTAVMGVGEALKAANDQQTAFVANPRIAAMAVEDAARAITTAEQNAAQAQVDAARRVEDAKTAVQTAVAAAADAVQRASDDEVMATRRVTEAQQGLRNIVEDVADAQRRAARDVEVAQRRQATAAREVTKSQKALADARALAAKTQKPSDVAAVAAAEDRLSTAQERSADAVWTRQEAQRAAARQQRDGAQQVARAQQTITDALKAQKDAQQAVVRAQQDGAKQVAKAQQAVVDATRAGQQSQAQAATAVAEANRNLTRLQLQQADAAEKAGAKSAAAMAFLTPSAQEAVRTLLTLKNTLDGVRRTAQENFFTGLSVGLTGLTTKLLPQLTTGVGAVATAFNGSAQQIMTSLGSALGGGVLNTLLQGVTTSVTILNRAVDPLVLSFVTLGVVGMQYMPRLAQWVATIATRFNNWIQATAADGRLVAWIDAGIQGIKDLWSIAGSVVGIFQQLSRAAAAGGAVSTLGGLAQGMRDMNTAMAGPAFQTTMSTIFFGAEKGARGLLAGLDQIGAAFTRGAPAFAEFLRLGGLIAGTFVGGVFTALSSPSFGAGLTVFMESLQRGVQAVAPLLPGLADAFGRILTVLGPIVAQLGPTLVQALTDVATAVGGILTVLQPVLSFIAGSPVLIGLMIVGLGGLSAAMLGVKIIMAAWTVATQVASGAQWLLNAAMRANPIATVQLAIVGFVTALMWFFTQTEWGRNIVAAAWIGIQVAIGGFVNWWNGTALPLIRVGLGILGAAFTWLNTNIIQPVFRGIGAVISWAWNAVILPAFNAIVGFVRNILAPVIGWLWNNVVSPAFRGIGAVISWVWSNVVSPAFNAIVGFVRNVIAPVLGWLWNNVVGPAFRGIGSWISSTWTGTILPVFNALVGFMRNVIAPVIGWLWRNVVEPMFGGMGRTIRWVWDSVISPAFNLLRDAITKTIPDAFRTGVNAVKRWWDGLMNIAKAPIRFVVNTVINDGLIGAFNTVAGWLPGVGKLGRVKLPDGFARGGVLPGYQSAKRDDVLTPMRSGEGVLVPEAVRAIGADSIHALNGAANSGGVSAARRLLTAGAASGAPGGPSGGIWGALQQAASAAGRIFFPKRSFLGVDTEKAAKAWMGQSALDVRMGDGSPGIRDYVAGGPGGWGYYAGDTIWMQPGGPQTASDKIGVLVHEMGHALSLGHPDASDTSSVMNPMQRGGSWPQSGDYATLRRVWGNPGDGVKRYSASEVGIDAGGISNPIADLIGSLSSQFLAAFPGGGVMADLALGAGTKLLTGVSDWVGGKLGSILDGAKQVVNGIADRAKVTAWMTEALIKKGELNPGNLISGVNRAFKESGGNPNAVNDWDVNAKNGDPSRGLMQVIGATFRQYMEPGRGNVLDPVDNILASINYTRARYGSLQEGWNQPGGYALGGIVGQPTGALANAPYLYDQGGVLPPGLSQVVNLTRQPEHIYTKGQSEALQTLAARGTQQTTGVSIGQVMLPQQASVDDLVAAIGFQQRVAARGGAR